MSRQSRLLRSLVLVLSLTAVAGALGAVSAHAGVYAVRSCADARGDADRWGTNSSYYVGSTISCPWAYGSSGGLAVGSGGGPFYASGSTVFTAPPGTTVARMEGEASVTQSNGWQAGVYDFEHRRWLYCGPGNPCNTFGDFVPFAFDNFRANQLGAFLICGAPACNGGGGITLKNVTTYIEDFSPPQVGVSVPGGWVRGTVPIGIDANDNVGIKNVRLLADGTPRRSTTRDCDYFRAVPCPNGGGSLGLSTADGLGDDAHTVTVQAFDSADNANSVSQPILIDNTAPGQIVEPAVESGESWRSSNRFALSWVTPAQPGVAPIAAVEYELCPADKRAGDPACRRGTRPPADFLPKSADGAQSPQRSLLDGVEVPGVGVWTARVWLRDEAGNQNPETARLLTLRFDNEPPSLAFQPLDPMDPTRLHVTATDVPSGVARASVELQRSGEAAWRPLDVHIEDGGFSVSLDDERLPDGIYALRAQAVDQAGNERSTDRFADGKAAEVALPVRVRTRLAVGKPKRVRIKRRPKGSKRRYRTTLLARHRLPYGRPVRLQGRLTTPGGNPLTGTEVQVSEQVEVPGAAPRQIGTVSTSMTGRFSFKLSKGPSRVVRFRYGGTRTIRPDTGEVHLRVRSSTSFAVSRRRVVNGEAVIFRGHLRGGNVPAEGKLIALQAFTRGRWRPFATTRADPQSGRWEYTYRFDGTRGTVRYRFRARVLREATYPFSTGTSARRRVVVRGLR